MLRRPLLEACGCPVVNYHSGINPAYRGINGGYFALANGEPEHFGVTLHLVDLGVDTGLRGEDNENGLRGVADDRLVVGDRRIAAQRQPETEPHEVRGRPARRTQDRP